MNQTKINLKSVNKRLFLIVLALAGIFFVSQILATSKVGTKSSEIELIRREKDTLRLENEIIKSKIDENKSVGNIDETAKKLGLQQKKIHQIESVESQTSALK